MREKDRREERAGQKNRMESYRESNHDGFVWQGLGRRRKRRRKNKKQGVIN